MPAAVDADVSCSTVNGEVRSDFPATSSGRWGPHHTGATLGRGGAKVSASTVNGSIWLQRVGAK
jgi:DUF4097 and DUF4098 domain-containing protein YvlB